MMKSKEVKKMYSRRNMQGRDGVGLDGMDQITENRKKEFERVPLAWKRLRSEEMVNGGSIGTAPGYLDFGK